MKHSPPPTARPQGRRAGGVLCFMVSKCGEYDFGKGPEGRRGDGYVQLLVVMWESESGLGVSAEFNRWSFEVSSLYTLVPFALSLACVGL